MKVDLEKIMLGHSPLSGKIFAGTILKPGVWRHKVDVTDVFMGTVIDRFRGHIEVLECSDGKTYEITVKEITKKK